MRRKEPSTESVLAAELAKITDVASYRAAHDAMELCAIGRAAARLAAKRCNGVEAWDAKAGRWLARWNDADEAAAERTAQRLADKAAAILTKYAATLDTVQGDPRGACLRFTLATGQHIAI